MVVGESKLEMSQATELVKRFHISELELSSTFPIVLSSLYESFLASSPWSIRRSL